MGELFSMTVHHGGYFTDNPQEYVGGKVDLVDNCDLNRWSKVEIEGIYRNFEYTSINRQYNKMLGMN